MTASGTIATPPSGRDATLGELNSPPRDEVAADEAQTERQAPNEESPGEPASTDQ